MNKIEVFVDFIRQGTDQSEERTETFSAAGIYEAENLYSALIASGRVKGVRIHEDGQHHMSYGTLDYI